MQFSKLLRPQQNKKTVLALFKILYSNLHMQFIRYFILLPLLGLSLLTKAQLGGKYTYEFLDLPTGSRIAALGGDIVPIFDKDLSLAINNPSLLNSQMNNYILFHVSDYHTDIKYGTVAYAKSFKKGITAMADIQYINYGDFLKTDEFGYIIGQFNAKDYAYKLSVSKQFSNKIYAGATFKFVSSRLETYNSYGVLFDLAVSYVDTANLFTASLVADNMGFQIKTYSGGANEPLPLNIQLGFSKKLAHMPLRIVIVVHHLNVLDFTYQNPATQNQNVFGSSTQQNNSIPLSDKIFRHFIVGGEFVLTKNFFIQFSYNDQRRKEMTTPGMKGLTGYAWGFGLRLSKFYLSYANSIDYKASRVNHFTFATNVDDWVKIIKKI